MQGHDAGEVAAERPRSPPLAAAATAAATAAAAANAAAAKGILRDAAPLAPNHHTVAFMDPHHGANARREYRLEGSALTDTSGESDPLIFAKRPVLGLNNRSRSSFSTTCTSPTSEASLATNQTSAYTRTPSLCRSETEASDLAADDSVAVADEDDEERTAQPISLLTAALMAEDAVGPRRVSMSCGILRKETSDGAGEQSTDAAKVSFAGQDAQAKPRFVEPPRPSRHGFRRVSLPPPQAKGPRLSVSPEHYSEGPESPPRPLVFDAQAHASFLPSAGPSRLDEQKPAPAAATAQEQPARRRTLVFQDAEGVKERARARAVAAEAAAKAAARVAAVPEANAEAGPSSLKVHPSDVAETKRRSRSPSPPPAPAPIRPPPSQQAVVADRKLKFAASPSELRRSASTRASTTRLRRARPLSHKASESASSDEEGPYVDSVAAASSQRSNGGRPQPRRHRSGSPAPKKLGGPEMRRSSGKGRPRSPAPRGRVALPKSASSDVDADDLDYEEDDEGSESDDEEEEDDEEDSSDDYGEDSEAAAPVSTSPGGGAGVAIPSNSPRPSVDSHSHPTAFSHSDFEDEDGLGERATDADFGPSSYELPLVHSRQRSPNPWPISNHGSPLSFARGRLPTPALSDAEGLPSSRCPSRSMQRPINGAGSKDPSLSPSRSRSHLSPGPTTAKPVASRSFSSVDPRRCEPSTFASSEQALGGTSPPYAFASASAAAGGAGATAHSPDAWTMLRSCLESAMLSGDEQQQAQQSQSQSQQQQRWRRPAWSSARSTPGVRSAVMSPNRTTVPLDGGAGSSSRSNGNMLGLGQQQMHSFSTAALLDSSMASHAAANNGAVHTSSPSAGPSRCPSPVLTANGNGNGNGNGVSGGILAPPLKLDSDVESKKPSKPIRIDSHASPALLSREDGNLAGIGEEQARRMRRKEQQHQSQLRQPGYADEQHRLKKMKRREFRRATAAATAGCQEDEEDHQEED